MVHNGIEYGLMQAYAEGFDILKNANIDALPEAHRFDLDIADIAEVWRRGSVIPSWLLDLTSSALAENHTLEEYSGFVEDSGEGRWTVNAAIDEAVPAEVLTAALYARFRSRKEHTFAEKILSAMRAGFGGHKEPQAQRAWRRQTESVNHGDRQDSPEDSPIPAPLSSSASPAISRIGWWFPPSIISPRPICCRKISAWSASPATAMSNDELRDSLMKGLRQFATRPVDEAIAKRLFECVTCIEADPSDPASFDRMSEQLDKLEARARPAATGCSTWQRRPARSSRSARSSAGPGC